MKTTYIIPTKNSAKTIAKTIQSIQQMYTTECAFDILVIDDDSDDNTIDVVKRLQADHTNIQYRENDEYGVIESLNFGLYEVEDNTDYVTFMRPDDVLEWTQMQHKLNMLSANNLDLVTTTDNNIWGTVIRYSAIKGNDYFFESYWRGAELYRFLYKYNITNLMRYKDDYTRPDDRYSAEIVRANKLKLDILYYTDWRDENFDDKLTAIITFKNEGDEIERTVSSIRATTAKNVHILLIDDGSDDGYNYQAVADKYNCQLERTVGLGIARARDLGVTLCQTPYFVILDAHIRFYSDGWDNVLRQAIQTNQKAIYTTTNIHIHKNGYDKLYLNESGDNSEIVAGGNGAIVHFAKHPFTCNYNGAWPYDYAKDGGSIPCVLGAVYASSKWWWERIKGLNGLRGWGLDEPLMSIKTYLLGGDNILLTQPVVGHVYRKSANYKSDFQNVICNQLYLIYLFSEDDVQREMYKDMLRADYGEIKYNDAYTHFIIYHYAQAMQDRNYLQTNSVRDMRSYMRFNGDF